jgi:hypothetical protein
MDPTRPAPARIELGFLVLGIRWIGGLLWVLDGTWQAGLYGGLCGAAAGALTLALRRRVAAGSRPAEQGWRPATVGRVALVIGTALIVLSGAVVAVATTGGVILALTLGGLALAITGALVAATFRRW